MRILKLVNGNDDGGVFTSETNYIKCLSEKGILVDLVIIGSGDRVDTYKGLANQSIVLPALNARLSGSVVKKFCEVFKIWKYGNTYKNKIRTLERQYLAIIYRRPVFLFLAGMTGKSFLTKVYWHMPNGVSSGFSRRFYRYFLNRYKITPIANSEYTKSSLPNVCNYVVYPGFAPDRVYPGQESFRSELKIPFGAPVFGMAGRICVDKAQDTLIKSFVASDAISRGAHLVLAGGFENDSFRRELLGLAGDYLNKQIHFLGKINDLPKFYSTIDVALNSRRNAEPFGISIAEGLAAGKPVIAYYLGGPSEMIENKSSGWLVKAPDVNSWTKAFNISLAARPYWKAMGEKAKEGVRKFSVETNVSKLLTIIEK